MPRRGSEGRSAANLAGTLQDLIEQIVQREVQSSGSGAGVAQEVRALRHAVAKLERRLDSLSRRMPARLRRPAHGDRRGPGRPPTHTKCTVGGCTAPHYARGLCSRHYQRQRRSDLNPATTRTRRSS